MITLGIELSSRQGSVALLKDGALLAEKTWIADRVRHNGIFQTLDTLLEEAHISYYDISLYAVGRGPGSFSGMRMSFAIAQALALPNQAEVRAVSSGAALAQAAARDGAKEIAVVGDARRGQVWIGFFQTLENGVVECSNDWKLVPYEEVSVSERTLIVSPEAERLIQYFPTIGNPRFPLASDVALLAERLPDSEPLEPLYMHPPVFIEPKFG
jgi:tRNA threonylcarbamoyladenosine biosynthesis protein TsaB